MPTQISAAWYSCSTIPSRCRRLKSDVTCGFRFSCRAAGGLTVTRAVTPAKFDHEYEVVYRGVSAREGATARAVTARTNRTARFDGQAPHGTTPASSMPLGGGRAGALVVAIIIDGHE